MCEFSMSEQRLRSELESNECDDGDGCSLQSVSSREFDVIATFRVFDAIAPTDGNLFSILVFAVIGLWIDTGDESIGWIANRLGIGWLDRSLFIVGLLGSFLSIEHLCLLIFCFIVSLFSFHYSVVRTYNSNVKS